MKSIIFLLLVSVSVYSCTTSRPVPAGDNPNTEKVGKVRKG